MITRAAPPPAPRPTDPAVWKQTAKLQASDEAQGDFFGNSVAISGGAAAVGASGDDDIGHDSGSAYLFQRDPLDPEVWTQTAKLIAADGAPEDLFGIAIALAGDTLMLGATYGDGLELDSGAVYLQPLERCELALAVHPLTVRAGEELRVAVDLDHRRPITVTVPLLLWIEDAAGRVVAQRSSPPVTMAPGDHRQVRMALTVPPGLPSGTYRVVVGVRRMLQGIAWGSQEIRVVE